MSALPGEILRIYQMSVLITISTGQSSMQFFPSLIVKINEL